MSTKYRHRVERVRDPKAAPALPKESIQTGPREVFVPRTQRLYDIVWAGQKSDPDLRDMSPNLWK
jgi:hypothetical protein